MRAISASGAVLPFRRIADVREITRSTPTFDRSEMISSVKPSLKYALSGSALRLPNCSTTIERSARRSNDVGPAARAGARTGGAAALSSSARTHLEHQHAEAPDVGLLCGALPSRLLGGHVSRRSQDYAAHGLGRHQRFRVVSHCSRWFAH